MNGKEIKSGLEEGLSDQPCPTEGDLELGRIPELSMKSKSGNKVRFGGKTWVVEDRGSHLDCRDNVFVLVDREGNSRTVSI